MYPKMGIRAVGGTAEIFRPTRSDDDEDDVFILK